MDGAALNAGGANLSGAPHAPWNASLPSAPPGRSVSAAALLLLALAGNGLLLQRLRCGGRCCCWGQRRRTDVLLAHLAVADLCACGLLLMPQLPAASEVEPAWRAPCGLLRFLQGSGALAPAHLLVLMALERSHVAARRPQPCVLAALGWLLALLLALPEAFVHAPRPGGGCLSVLARRPRWHGQAYAVYAAVVGFGAPACLLGGTCGRLLSALGAQDGGDLLPAPRARALQLILALAALFALCGFPRFVLELGAAFASPHSGAAAHEACAALSGLLAAANPALNPYVCLFFHSRRPCARRLQRGICRCPSAQPPRRAPCRRRAPPSPANVDRAGLWLCPCQARAPEALVAAQQGERQAGESGL